MTHRWNFKLPKNLLALLRVITKITFTKQPIAANKARKGTIIYNLSHDYETFSTWDALTDTGSITLPRNVYITDQSGKRFPLGGTNVNLGGFDSNDPVFLRGDKVKIEWGYAYYDLRGNEVAPMRTVFEGFISSVTSKKPFVLKIEDNMYLLKQKQAAGTGGRKFFAAASYTIESALAEMMKAQGLPFTVNNLTNTSAGDLIVGDETIAQLLARLRKDYNFKSYFRGNELRVGSKVYLDSDIAGKTPPKFIFQRLPAFDRQGNIIGCVISDELEYQRKEDIEVSTVAKAIDFELTGQQTKDGYDKTRKVKLEVLITLKNGSDTPEYFVGTKDKPIPANTGGQRYTDNFPRGTSLEQLKQFGLDNLRLRYYTGMRGTFTTLGMPFVVQGDNIDLLDPLIPERNGRYKVKSVKYNGGVGGLRQTIELDYLVARLDNKGKVIQTTN